jgi:hypothetical protein
MCVPRLNHLNQTTVHATNVNVTQDRDYYSIGGPNEPARIVNNLALGVAGAVFAGLVLAAVGVVWGKRTWAQKQKGRRGGRGDVGV